MKITVVIPALNPDEAIRKTIVQLLEKGFERIIIVDDGSDSAHQSHFLWAEENPHCVVLRHARNLGKGRALKTAFNYFLCYPQGHDGVVTVDADGQHHPEDVLACACYMQQHKNQLTLGCRDFSLPDVPPKSRWGNRSICFLFRFFAGIQLGDTQTGLRAFPTKIVDMVLDMKGERFEYETTMLLELKRRNVSFGQVPIRTIYENNNKGTHFRPIQDSLQILHLMLKFVAASLGSFVVDIGAFAILSILLESLPISLQIFLCTMGARAISSAVNYFVNKKVVFSKEKTQSGSLLRYYLLCVAQAIASFAGVFALVHFLGSQGEVLFKSIVDVLLFLVSFHIQRDWVFKEETK